VSQLGRKVTDCVLVWSKRGHFSGANESLCPMRSFVQVLVLSSDPVWSDAVPLPYGPMCSDAVRTPVISHSRLRTLVSGNLQGDITRGSVLDSLLPLSHNHTDKQTDTYLLTYLLTHLLGSVWAVTDCGQCVVWVPDKIPPDKMPPFPRQMPMGQNATNE